MLDKKKLLMALTILKDKEKKHVNETKTAKENDIRMGSLITLETIIKFINEGKFDKN